MGIFTRRWQIRRFLTLCFAALAGMAIVAAVGRAEPAQLTAMRVHYHADEQKTRITLVFDKKIDYEQIPGIMLIEFRLRNTVLSDFVRPAVNPSDPFLKDFKLTASRSDGTTSLILLLQKPAKSHQFWLPPSHQPRLVIDLQPTIGPSAIVQNLQTEEKPPTLKDSSSQQTPADTDKKEEEWAFQTEENFAPLSLSTTAQNQEAAATEPQSEAIDSDSQILPESVLMEGAGKTPQIPQADSELRNAIVVQADTSSPEVAETDKGGWFPSMKALWLYLQIPLDLLLVGGLAWLWLRARRSDQLIRDIAGYLVETTSRGRSSTPSSFDQVLQESVSEVVDLPRLDESPRAPKPLTKSASSLKRRSASDTPNSSFSTEDIKQALARINSEIEALMERNLGNSLQGGNEDEETTLENDQSLKAVVRRMARKGMSEAQIAQHLGLPREEVALMLNIRRNGN